MTAKKHTDDAKADETVEATVDNTPTPHVAAPKDDGKKAPAGYAYVVHPKNGQRCLVDEKSLPELLADGYTTE